jgi:hypothetical protein
MPQCLIPNCTNNASHNLGIRCRRPETTAIWAPNCDAFLCDEHADQGYTINITLTPVQTKTITTIVSAGRTTSVRRITPITHDSIE